MPARGCPRHLSALVVQTHSLDDTPWTGGQPDQGHRKDPVNHGCGHIRQYGLAMANNGDLHGGQLRQVQPLNDASADTDPGGQALTYET